MKINELSNELIRQYLKLNDEDDSLIEIFKSSAFSYIKGYTGLDDNEINASDEITMAYLVLIQDFYDNRQYSSERNYSNKAVDTILGMNRKNFIPKSG